MLEENNKIYCGKCLGGCANCPDVSNQIQFDWTNLKNTNLLALKEYYVFVSSTGEFYKINDTYNGINVSLTNITSKALKGSYEDMKRYYTNLKEEPVLTGVEFIPVSIIKITELIEEDVDSKISIEELIETVEFEKKVSKYRSKEKSFTVKTGLNSVEKNTIVPYTATEAACNCDIDDFCTCGNG